MILTKYLQHIVKSEPKRWLNKTCIELGAGTGIVACALASLGVPGLDIYSTDLAELLPLARKNVTLNGLENKVKVEEIYWGRPLPDTVPHQPDLLLLADCIYVCREAVTQFVAHTHYQLEVTFPWLLSTMLLLTNDKTEILLAFKKRRKADKRFFLMAKKHFTFEHVRHSGNHRRIRLMRSCRYKMTRTSQTTSEKVCSCTRCGASLRLQKTFSIPMAPSSSSSLYVTSLLWQQ